MEIRADILISAFFVPRGVCAGRNKVPDGLWLFCKVLINSAVLFWHCLCLHVCVDIGLYQSASALDGLQQHQDIISSNIAGSSVPGYKKTVASFESVEAGLVPKYSEVQLNDDAPAYFSTLKGQLSFHQGELRQTNNPLDFALKGEGFFQLEDEETGEQTFTRNGQFRVNSEGVLVNGSGIQVQGDAGVIQTVPGQGDLVIDLKGQVFQGATQIGKLSIVNIEDPEKSLRRVNGGFIPQEGAEVQAEAAEGAEVLQGFVETSNAKPLKEMVNMIQVSRAYDANHKMIQQVDSLMGRAIATLGNTQ